MAGTKDFTGIWKGEEYRFLREGEHLGRNVALMGLICPWESTVEYQSGAIRRELAWMMGGRAIMRHYRRQLPQSLAMAPGLCRQNGFLGATSTRRTG